MKFRLKVPYADKELAKAKGARWDKEGKFWYLYNPTEEAIVGVSKWLDKEVSSFVKKHYK